MRLQTGVKSGAERDEVASQFNCALSPVCPRHEDGAGQPQHQRRRRGVAAPRHAGRGAAGAQHQGRGGDRIHPPALALLHRPHGAGILQAAQRRPGGGGKRHADC